MRWVHKSATYYNSVGQSFDYALIGHWHSLIYGQSVVINGSLKGYDEYAKRFKFGFERPQQALFYVAPERGITMRTAVHAD